MGTGTFSNQGTLQAESGMLDVNGLTGNVAMCPSLAVDIWIWTATTSMTKTARWMRAAN